MSGSGGTVYDSTRPRGACECLTFRTVLNSPVPDVVSEIGKRAGVGLVRLVVEIEVRGTLRIAIASFEGRRAGAITSDALLWLLECIAAGNEYVAEVKTVFGARVEVQVMRK